MPYANVFARVVMAGTTYPGESFSCGLNMIAPGFGTDAVQPTNLAPFVAACSAWFGRTDTGIAAVALLRQVKVNLIGVDGLYVSKTNTVVADLGTPVPGGKTGFPPAQLTVAVTLKGDKVRGPASAGRIFPPLCSPQMASNGLMDPPTVLAIGNSMMTLINALNAIDPAGLRVGLVTDRLSGAETTVTRVQVGRVVDTQRRRRRSLLEQPVPATTALVP